MAVDALLRMLHEISGAVRAGAITPASAAREIDRAMALAAPAAADVPNEIPPNEDGPPQVIAPPAAASLPVPIPHAEGAWGSAYAPAVMANGVAVEADFRKWDEVMRVRMARMFESPSAALDPRLYIPPADDDPKRTARPRKSES